MPNSDYSKQQLRLVIVDKIPESEKKYEEFKTNTLGFMITSFMDSYHLYRFLQEPSIKKILDSKPDTITIGNYQYKAASMTFDNIETKFLITIANKTAYMFTLVSIDENKKMRKMNMAELIEVLKTAKLYGINPKHTRRHN